MARLVIRTGPSAGVALTLRPGVNRVGRHADNDVQIEDDSVSGYHCELTPEAFGIVVRDLGSTNGTFIEGEPVEEAVLQTGQTLQIGTVQLLFEPPVRMPATPPPVQPAPLPVGVSPCHSHPEIPAEWLCNRCHHLLCGACAIPRQHGGKSVRCCPHCGGPCVPFGLVTKPKPEDTRTFYQHVPEAFGYPFRGQGISLLLAGAVFFTFLTWLQSRAWLIGIWLSVLSGGYLFAFVQSVIQTSAQGEERPPPWPDFGDWWNDIIRPYLLFLVLALLCLGPALLMGGYALRESAEAEEWVVMPLLAALGLGLLGIGYLPMAVLGVAMADSVSGANPLLVIPSILRVPLEYFVTCLILIVAFAANYLGQFALGFVRVPLATSLVSWFLFLYCLLVSMRLVGILYWTNRDRLKWV